MKEHGNQAPLYHIKVSKQEKGEMCFLKNSRKARAIHCVYLKEFQCIWKVT